MSDFWATNRAALAATQPDLIPRLEEAAPYTVETSGQGHPVLRVQGTTLHSPADPAREAARWLDRVQGELTEGTGWVVVFGLGLGWHVEALLGASQCEVHVFEPDTAVVRTALEHRDLTAVIASVKLHLDLESVPVPAKMLVHQPSARLHPDTRQALADRLAGPIGDRPAGEALRILVVLPVWGGSLPVGRAAVRALTAMGHEVETIDASQADYFHGFIRRSVLQEAETDPAAAALINFFAEFVILRCREFRPDLVLALAQAPLSPQALRRLRDRGFVTAMWFVENYRVMPYYSQVAGAYDHFFVIQPEPFLSRLRDLGANPHYLPLAADPEVHRPLPLEPGEAAEYGADVAFLGEGYPNRQRFFAGLLDYDLKVWGTGWDPETPLGARVQRGGARIETDEVVKIYNATRINLNLHSAVDGDGVDPEGDFVNPRTFEIAACGGFQLVDRRALLTEFFEPDQEMAVFGDLAELRSKLDHYLAHPEERSRLAEAGRRRVLAEHTYHHRMERMLAVIFPERFRAVPRAAPDPETEAVLRAGGFDPAQERDLAAVARAIQEGEGRLGAAEAHILLLDELGRRGGP